MRQESDRLLINSSGENQESTKSMVRFFTTMVVLSVVLLVVIGSIVLNGLVFNQVNSLNDNNNNNNNGTGHSIIVNNRVTSVDRFKSGSKIAKGEPVGLCGLSLSESNVCSMDGFSVTSSIMQRVSPLNGSTNELISSLSSFYGGVTVMFTQHVRNSIDNSNSLLLHVMSMDWPILYLGVTTIDIFKELNVKPLAAGESFKLMGQKIFSAQKLANGQQVTRILVTFVRSSPLPDSSFENQFTSVVVTFIRTEDAVISLTVDVNHVVNQLISSPFSADKEFDVKQFTIGLASPGESTTSNALFLIYFNSINAGKCQMFVMNYLNNQLNLASALQDGLAKIDCTIGLTSFTYDESNVVILSFESLSVVSINSQNGQLTLKANSYQYLRYRSILSSGKVDAQFIGNDYEQSKSSQNHRSSQFFGIYSNPTSGHTEITQIVYDGDSKFDSFRLSPMKRPMFDVSASFIDSNTLYLVYHSFENIYKARLVQFVNEQETTYTISTAIEGIEFNLGELSPNDWSLQIPSSRSFGVTIMLMFNPITLKYDLAELSVPLNAYQFIGISTQDSEFGKDVQVITDGITPTNTFNDGTKFIVGKSYFVYSIGAGSRLSVLGNERGLRVGKAVSPNQILVSSEEQF